MLTVLPVIISVLLGIFVYNILNRVLKTRRGVSIGVSAAMTLVFMVMWLSNLSEQLNT